ncbi:MAG: DUF3667 domain-containing protein [Haliscomenobacter sp.]|nr:DUF3667 domain-containing protein [Haliscomenobacter sp.]
MAEICKNCKTEVPLNYCPTCGHPKSLKRIDGQYLLDEIIGSLSFEKGFLFTIRELAVNPGKSIKDFLREDRTQLVRPIVFLIITSLIYTFFNSLFHFEDSYVKFSGNEASATLAIFKWVQENYGYANIIMAVFIGFWLKLLFRKYLFNFFEILILLCFAMAMGMLIYSVFGVFQGLTHINLMQVGGIVGFLYTTYVVGQFFDKSKPISYFKAFIAYLIGMISFSLAAIAIGTIIDLVIQK